ncbi:major facilitator superfamily domain-containing protein [Jimgerdemannia flammicorona]|uniref:Major facilitator superfamily domain-containing protein n=1 Tax=Jimgerdemannia flammicorona TaxID=994334 RepID=A0A433DIQ8_9FUNG|nr:major facilitator superfamily domain-containing protein [Jimgerdemannia flammicorona]
MADTSIENREEFERQLVRKIDLRLLPILLIMYILNHMDRTKINIARIAGMEADLHLDGNAYNWSLSIFFFGYIILEVPSNLLLAKTRPSLYIPSIMFIWACISMAMAAVQNFEGLMAARFFLGVAEAGFFPGCLFLLSSWYKKHELAIRTAIFYCGSLISGAFGGLLAFGITDGLSHSPGGLAPWRWLFLIEGLATVIVAIIAVFILPDFPSTTKWLTDEERNFATARLLEGRVAVEHKSEWSFRSIIAVLKDWHIYLLMNVTAGTISYFMPTLVKNLGYISTTAQLMTAPPYLFAVVCALINAIHSDRKKERMWHIVVPMTVAMIGFILNATVTNSSVLYFAIFLCAAGIWSAVPTILSWTQNIISEPDEKRAVAISTLNMIGNLSSVYGAQLYPSSDGPRYIPGHSSNAVFCAFAVILAFTLQFLQREAAKKLEDLEMRDENVNDRMDVKG